MEQGIAGSQGQQFEVEPGCTGKVLADCRVTCDHIGIWRVEHGSLLPISLSWVVYLQWSPTSWPITDSVNRLSST